VAPQRERGGGYPVLPPVAERAAETAAPAMPPALAQALHPPQLPPAEATPMLTPQGRPTPALVARVQQEVTRELERARPALASRCVPPGEASTSRLTFNVTFDANGREVARGISEDRRAPAPKIASCLRKLPVGSLRVAAPGAHVGVRVAMTLP
jgi:hypothetical protein